MSLSIIRFFMYNQIKGRALRKETDTVRIKRK